jgi:membrane-associated phospholipid phosphatase
MSVMLFPRSHQARNSLLGCALLGLVSTVAVLRLDDVLSENLRAIAIPGDLKKAVNLAEVFAHGFGVTAILGSILIVAVDKRRAVCGAIAITALAGISANLSKQAIVRIRPNSQGLIEVIGAAQYRQPASNKEQGELEKVAPSFWDSRQRSFPSGHAATAWGLAIGLSLVFPKGIWLFACFASLACLQRVVSGAHFPSDVFAGSAIAFFVAALAFSVPSVRGLFPEALPQQSGCA